MYTYFYVCTWYSVHMCIVSISVIHTCIWRQDLYVYVMCVYVWYILECGRQCRTLNFFSSIAFFLVMLWQHLSLNLKVNISAGLVGSTCSTPTHSQSWDYMYMQPCSAFCMTQETLLPSETSPFLHMFVLSSVHSKEQINSLIVTHKYFDTETEAWVTESPKKR